MRIFKVSFNGDKIKSITEENSSINFSGDYYFFSEKGFVVYALVKADDDKHARTKASEIALDVHSRNFE